MTQHEWSEARRLAPRVALGGAARFDLGFPLLFGLAYALVAIGLHRQFFPIGDVDLESDFYGDLVVAARHLLEGRFSVVDFAWKGPLYALALNAVRALTHDWYLAATIVSALSAGAFLYLAYRLVRHLFDRRTAIVSMILSALVVELAVLSHRAVTDVLFLALVYASIGCMLIASGSLRWQALAGALAGFAFLTRYNGIFLVPATAAVLTFANPDGETWRQRARRLAVYLGAFLLAGLPWFIANWQETGRLLASRNLENVVTAYYGDLRWQDDPSIRVESLTALVARDPGHFATRYVHNLVEHATRIVTRLLGWPLGILPILGIVGLLWRPPTRRQASLYLYALVYWLFMGIVFYQPRFFLPMILPAVVAGVSLWRREGAWRWTPAWRLGLEAPGRSQIPIAIVATLVAVVALMQVQRIVAAERTLYERRPLYVLEAGRALAALDAARATGAGAPRILARKGHIAAAAGFDFTPISVRTSSLEELLANARAVDAEYIAYSKIEYSMLPRLLFLAVMDDVPLLQEVYRSEGIRIFRVADANRTELTQAERGRLLRANLQAARTQARPAAIFSACDDLGRHCLENGEFADAARAFQWAIDVALVADDPQMRQLAASARHHLAGARLGLDEPTEALRLLEENLTYYEREGTPRLLALTHGRMAHAYARLGREDDAARARRRARDLDPSVETGARAESLPSR